LEKQVDTILVISSAPSGKLVPGIVGLNQINGNGIDGTAQNRQHDEKAQQNSG